MKIYIKVTIAFFALFFGVVALMETSSTSYKKGPFQLIDQVEESEFAFHADLTKIFQETDKYSKEVNLTLAERVIISQVKQELQKSGIKLKETYLTYEIYGSKTLSFYAEISDTILFEVAFGRLLKHFKLEASEENPFFYLSSTADISIEKREKYVKINWGKNAAQFKPQKVNHASPLFKKLLASSGMGVINTTGTTRLDSSDYATFTYEYEQDFSFTANWKVLKNHPLQLSHKSIPIYSSQKNNIQAYSNIDLKSFHQNINPYLKQKGIDFLAKLPQAAKELLDLWNGQASLQIGGKTTKETIQYITEFDDDFNQIEKKIVKTDSFPDLGFYWGTNQPQRSYDALLNMPNVKMQNNQLQMALFPPLKIVQEKNALKATATSVDFKIEKYKYMLYINSEMPTINGKLTIQKLTKDVVQINLTLKEPVIPKKLNMVSFW